MDTGRRQETPKPEAKDFLIHCNNSSQNVNIFFGASSLRPNFHKEI